MNSTYKLSDDVIATLGKLLQLAILTGTDVTDWFRMIEVTPDPDNGEQLVVSPAYNLRLEKQIEDLERQADEIMKEVGGEHH